MSRSSISRESFAELFPTLCAHDTAAGGGKGWTPDNPTWGHCAVASLLAQREFGGELLRISLARTEFAEGGSHYFNRFPDGDVCDVTKAQFGGRLRWADISPAETRTRAYVIGGADTRVRYAKIAFRFAAATSGGNALFDDPIYRACLIAAYASPCKKSGFGAVVFQRNRGIVATDNNHQIDCLRDLCEPQCIRLRIVSRTESMIGACGHAEEWALKEARDAGARLDECDLYVAGVAADGTPLIKDFAEHSCLRCAIAMHFAGLRSVQVPVRDHWEALTTAEVIGTARAYALGQKKA